MKWLMLLVCSASYGATWKVGPSETYTTPCLAIYAAAAGDTIEITPGTYRGWHAVCYIQIPLTIRPSAPGRVVLDARGTENRAWNVYDRGTFAIELTDAGGTVDISGVDFIGAAVSDGDGHNGAGIRLSRGSLKCTGCGFYFNQNGILSSALSGKVEIVDSVFAYNGTGGGYEHNLYIAGSELIFHHSTSRNSLTGQAVKCRAPKCTIEYSLLGGGSTNVEVEMPNGGEAAVRGNLIIQSPETTNSHVISTGAEGANPSWLHSSLIEYNTIVGYRHINNFFRHISQTSYYPGPVVIRNNVIVGEPDGAYFIGSQPLEYGNYYLRFLGGVFVADVIGDYRLTFPATAGAYPIVPLPKQPPAAEIVPYANPGPPIGFHKAGVPPRPEF